MKQISLARMAAINANWFGVSFLWSGLHIIILPAVILHLVSENYKNTALGLLTMLGFVIAMIVQPMSGAISDRWVSRWGRRRPLIVLGTAIEFIFLAILAWAGGLGWLALGYLGLQFSANIAHGPAQGLIPDLVSRHRLGRASGLKNLLDISGLIASSLLIGRVLSMDTRHPVQAVGMSAAILAAATVITLISARETPIFGTRKPIRFRQTWHEFILSARQVLKSSFGRIIASRFLFLVGIYGIQVFALYYIRDVIRAPDPIKLTGDLLATITLTLVVCSLAGGWFGDRYGHQYVQYVACAVGGLGCLLMFGARSPTTLLAYGVVLGIGIGLFLTSNWALAIQHAPAAQAAKYLGLTNLATAGAGAISRLQGPFIDGLNNANPGAWWGYNLLFVLGALGIFASAVLLWRSKLKY